MNRSNTIHRLASPSSWVLGFMLGGGMVNAAPSVPTPAASATGQFAILTQDQTPLRAAPRDSAQQQGTLAHGAQRFHPPPFHP